MSKKNGTRDEWFTPIPNAVLDEWMPRLSPAELRVVLYVLRRSAGFQKEWDQISLEQMMTGLVGSGGKRLDHGTGLSERACRGAIRSLVSRGALLREEAVAENGASDVPWYSLDLSWSPPKDTENGAGDITGVADSAMGRVAESARGEGGKTCQGGRVADFASHKRKNSPISPLAGEDEVGQVSPLVSSAKERDKERKTTPPPSSSSRGPGSITNLGGQAKLFDDDGKTENSSESLGRVEKETWVNGGRSKRAARKSWQAVSDEIKSLPEEAITGEARELAKVLGGKIPRIESARLERLSLYCIEVGGISHLATMVSSIGESLEHEARNPWSYLVKTLCPFPKNGSDKGGNEATSREVFERVYEAVQPRNTEDFFNEFVEEEEIPTADEDIRRSLEILQTIEGWPTEPADDREVLSALEEHFEEVAKRVPLHNTAEDYAEQVRSVGGLENALASTQQACPLAHFRAHLCEEAKFWRRIG